MTDSNELFDKLKSDFQSALDRETQIRVNYEQGLIPSLERDLEACRTHVTELTKERDTLLEYKRRSDAAWVLVEQANKALTTGIELAPSTT